LFGIRRLVHLLKRKEKRIFLLKKKRKVKSPVEKKEPHDPAKGIRGTSKERKEVKEKCSFLNAEESTACSGTKKEISLKKAK